MNNKICPLALAHHPCECLGEACALWYEETYFIEGERYTTNEGCALLKIVEKLDDLSSHIGGDC